MDISNLGLFRLLNKKMEWLTQRQNVVSQNIANSDTPHYKPSDLATFSFKTALDQQRDITPAVTNAAHLVGANRDNGPGRVRHQKHAYETKPDGNAVVLEEQMIKMSETQMDYNTITNLYRKQISMLKSAIGRGGS
ncbi:Flagellar basal body rod protein FlgB [Azospirillaceae bacterium]